MANDYTLPETILRLPELTYPVSLDTIGKSLGVGVEITVHCDQCGHRARLNLVKLAARLGMDYPSDRTSLVRVLHCSDCRAAGRPDKRLSVTCATAMAASTLPAGYFESRMNGA